jgi:predicted CopG family antitoxin
MTAKDIRATAISNEVYPMLVEMCASNDIQVADLIRELMAKQQLIEFRAGLPSGMGKETRQ